MRRYHGNCAVFALLVLCSLSSALAQGGTLAAIQGRITGPDGRPLAGVTVTVRGSTGALAPATAVTDDDGRYRIGLLPPGSGYRLTAESAGREPVEAGPLDLAPGRTVTLDLVLASPGAPPAAEPRAAALDLGDTRSATLLTGEFLSGLPFLGRVYQDALTLAPGVTDLDRGGNPNVNGARQGELQYRMDGANGSDPVTGDFAQNFNLESLAEVEVISTAAPAMLGGAQGGFANLITRSGGNEIDGSVRFLYRSDALDGDPDPADGGVLPASDEFTSIQPFVSVGGPILRDRLWYFAALEYLRIDTTVPTLGGTEAERTTWGWHDFLKFTWQASRDHRLALELNHDPMRFEGLGLDAQVDPGSSFIQEQGGLHAAVRWTANLGPKLQLETMASWLDTGIDVSPSADAAPCPVDAQGRCDPFREDVLTFEGATVSGPFFLTERDERSRLGLRSDLAIFVDAGPGGHEIRTGVELSREEYDGRFRADPVRFDDISAGFGGLVGTVSFLESFPRATAFRPEKNRLGLYLQDTFKPLPNLAIQVGLRYDRERIDSAGWTPFDPAAEAARFLELYAIGVGSPTDPSTGQPWTMSAALANPSARFDINGDGLDDLHCRAYDLDGAVFGDGMPDGVRDDFFTYFDGDFDGVADPDNPLDVVAMVPDGLADGASINPACDRQSGDTFALVSTLTRHQFDDTGGPFAGLAATNLDRDGDGIPAFCGAGDPTCVPGEVLDPDDIPGQQRTRQAFDIDNDDLAPRLSVAWDPWSDNRTQFFASWGRYYGTLHLESVALESFPDARSVTYDANDIPLGADAIPIDTGVFSVTTVDRDLDTPHTDEWTLGAERELSRNWVVRFAYVNREAEDQLQDLGLNHTVQDLDGDGVLDDDLGVILSTGGGGTTVGPDGLPDLFVVNPFFAEIFHVGNFNTSEFESYQLELTRRLAGRWQLTSSYVYSEARGDAEEFLSLVGNDPSNLGQEFALLDYDSTHAVKVSALGYLPANQTVGGIVQWSSGTPFSLIEENLSFDSIGNLMLRTNYATGQRNSERNEGIWIVNLSYAKRFRIGSAEAGFDVEVDNLLDDDDVRISSVDRTSVLGADVVRRFGRRWQLGLDVRF